MTLLELMVALAILGLCAGFAFSNLGPWLSQGKQARSDALFWRALEPAQLALNELAAAAIDPSARSISATDARFKVYLPRLSDAPVAIDLSIETANGRSRLVLNSPALAHESVLLAGTPPLRFALNSDALLLDAQFQGQWRPIGMAHFDANGPLSCIFDPIVRACR